MMLYIIIGFIFSCLFYVLGKKGYLSEYLYYSYNYSNVSVKERQEFSKKRYDSSNHFDGDSTIWAYLQLIIYIFIWPIVISFIVITKLFSKLIKEKK